MATKAELEHANEALVTERDRLLQENAELREEVRATQEDSVRILREAQVRAPRRCPVLRAGRAARRLVAGRGAGWTVAAVIAAAAAADEWELLELLDGKLP